MHIIVDTEKLSKQANQLLYSIEDAQSFIHELIEQQVEEITKGNSEQTVIEILTRLEKKIDNLEKPTRRTTIEVMSKENNVTENTEDDTNQNNIEAERKKAADELAKALDFFM